MPIRSCLRPSRYFQALADTVVEWPDSGHVFTDLPAQLPTKGMSSPVHHSHDNTSSRRCTKVDAEWKPAHNCTARFTVDERISERIGRDALDCVVDLAGELCAEPRLLLFVPSPCREEFLVRFWPEDNGEAHCPSCTLRRTSSQGIADPGFSRCSAHRRSSSARCVGSSSSSVSRSWSLRLSHSAIASSARSLAGSFSSCARLLDAIVVIYSRGPVHGNSR